MSRAPDAGKLAVVNSLFLLLAQAASVTPAAAPYPAASVLEAFGEACRNIQDIAQVETDLVDLGWTAEIPPADSPLGKLLAVGRAQAEELLDGPDDRMSDTSVFTRTVDGERLDIILSQVESEGMMVNGCRLYDVSEGRKISLADGEKWMGRAPDRSVDRDEISLTNWSPGYEERHDSFEIFYVPEGSPVIALTQFHGIALKADFVGETEK